MKQMTLADWMPEDCPTLDLNRHMNLPEGLDKDQAEEDHLPTDRPTDRPTDMQSYSLTGAMSGKHRKNCLTFSTENSISQ